MISREAYEAYTEALDMQYAEASQILSDYIDSFDWMVDYDTAKAQRNQVIELAHALIDIYGTNAATLAADFYEQGAMSAGVRVADALIADVPGLDSVATSIRAAASSLWGGRRDVDGFRSKCLASLRRYVKGMADETTIINARRDGRNGKGIRWARVPRGLETCAYCIMLASRGFVYYSEQSAELFGHNHENCDCDVICDFGDGGLEGYDFKEYLDTYDQNLEYDEYGHIEGGMDGQINRMRRALYPKQRDHINALRRARYAQTHGKRD